jgi:hypothetical protein
MKLLYLLAFPSLALAQEEGSGPRFYLSTERVFPPGEEASVKVEAREVERLQMRVYRIDDPAKYFDAQDDLHRPRESTDPPRASSIGLLDRGLRAGLHRILNDARKAFATPGRDAIKGALPRMHGAALEGAAPKPVEKVIPLLEGYELLDLFEHTFASTSEWSYVEIPIPMTEPGAYLIEGTAAGQVAHTVLLITDVALVSKQSSSTLLVWAVDPASGDPRPGTDVRVSVRGEVKGTGKTDRNGIARFDLGLASDPVIYGTSGRSFTLLDPRFFPANVPAPKAYVFTERPVYRPGQTAFVKGFVRNTSEERYVLPREGDVEIEVVDPKGNSWKKTSTKVSSRGSFDAEVELPGDPVFGTWTVYATFDGERHKGEFKMLAFVKPEVRLGVRLGRTAVRSGERVEGDVVGEYFFGAPYPGAEVVITVSRTRFYVPWYVDADYGWYYSDAEYQNTRNESVEEIRCTLSEKGECTFAFTTAQGSEDFTYVVEAVAQDPTGKTITGVAQLAVTRAAFRLEIDQASLVVAPGEEQELRVKAVDYEGRPVETEIRLVVKAEHVAADGVAEAVEVLNDTFRTEKDGIARIELLPKKGGYYAVTAEAKDDQGKVVTAEGFLFAAEDGSGIPYAPADLMLVTDKRSYFAGETALLLILAPSPKARVLFTVEGGDLYAAEVLETSHHAALARVKIGEKQTPNFFVSATAVAGGSLYARSRSIVVPPREKILRVEVAADRPRAQPREDVTFTVIVTDHAGKPVAGAEVALGIVDEAIYAISPEIAVPIESFFHHKKRNDVRTTDSISFRFFGSSRRLEGHARRAGRRYAFGSMKPSEDDRKVFKDTAGWFPELVTGADGKASATITLPDNLTAWRATARVITKDTAVGSGRGQVTSRKPLVVRVAIPPRVSEGDRGRGALLVQNLTGSDAVFDSALEIAPSNGDAQIAVTFDEPAKLGGLSVRHGQLARIPFGYAASGSGRAKVTARTKGGESADGLEAFIDVTPWAAKSVVTASGQTSGEARIATHELQIPEGVSSPKLRVDVYASTIGAIRRSLPYLVEFPYGCTEQTMSRFVPLLSARRAMTRLQIDAKELDAEVPRMIAGGLLRLAQLQHDDGGWGWWEEDATDLFMTAWVVEGLGEAIALGVDVPKDRIDGGIGAIERELAGGLTDPGLRAFALYALARHGVHKPKMLAELLAEGSLSPNGIAYAGLAAALAKDVDATAATKAKLEAAAVRAGPVVSFCDEAIESPDDHPSECTAVALRALVALSADRSMIDGAEAFLMARLDGDRFGTTRQTATAIRALAEAVETIGVEGATITVRVGGKEAAKITIDRKALADTAAIEPAVELSGKVTVEVEQTGSGTIFHSVAAHGLEKKESFAPETEGGLQIRRSFFELSGASGKYIRGASVERFREGEPLLVRLEVTASRRLSQVIIEDWRPAGLEAIERDTAQQVEGVKLLAKGVHREHKEDRTAFFVDELRSGKTELYYLARATLPGDYRTPPATAEAMYLPARHHGRSSSTLVSVAPR